MTVYVVTSGEYEEYAVCSVFATAAAAKAAYPITRPPYPQRADEKLGWQEESDGKWWNGLSFDYRIEVIPFEVSD